MVRDVHDANISTKILIVIYVTTLNTKGEWVVGSKTLVPTFGSRAAGF